MAVRDAYKLASTQVQPGSGFGAKAGQIVAQPCWGSGRNGWRALKRPAALLAPSVAKCRTTCKPKLLRLLQRRSSRDDRQHRV